MVTIRVRLSEIILDELGLKERNAQEVHGLKVRRATLEKVDVDLDLDRARVLRDRLAVWSPGEAGAPRHRRATMQAGVRAIDVAIQEAERLRKKMQG